MRDLKARPDCPILKNSLYVVATPIGNLDDITLRALSILHKVDLIAAEDTRHSAKLLQHYQIVTPLVAYHDHSDESCTQSLIDKLQQGKTLALICDAGTPLISDPGYALVKQAREAGFTVSPIPGACALIAALSGAGLPSNRFAFEGFAPAKQQARHAFFEQAKYESRTLIYYESPHRIEISLTDMCDVFGHQRQAVLCRELSKTYETFLSGSLSELLAAVQADPNQQRGEIVLLVHPYKALLLENEINAEAKHTMQLLLEELPIKKAAALAAKLTGERKNKLYQWALDAKSP